MNEQARAEQVSIHDGPVLPAKSYTILLLPGFSMGAFSGLVEPLRLANLVSGRALFQWSLVSVEDGVATASSGIRMLADFSIESPPKSDNVIVCGGVSSDQFQHAPTFAWLRQVASRGGILGATCTGSFALARAGLLSGHRCTVHWEHMASWVELFPDTELTGELFTVDRKRYTCAGGMASADMMLHQIASLHGDDLAARVSELALHPGIRPGSIKQNSIVQLPLGTDREDLRIAITIMMENLEDPLDLQNLAFRLGKSRRNLERLFRGLLNRSPAKYYLGLRLIRARQLLQQTTMPIVEIAISCGFSSSTHFSKCYKEYYGVSPKADRINLRNACKLAS
ncbi:MAG: GlxA family transcriptional regulator [Hyphomonadaceae bacterium]|nr:GlxA family transcriptional regulator [Hyphomonadaceae bacterium]